MLGPTPVNVPVPKTAGLVVETAVVVVFAVVEVVLITLEVEFLNEEEVDRIVPLEEVVTGMLVEDDSPVAVAE